jgi:hypothetical protein
VSSAVIAAPTFPGSGPGTLQVVDTGSFGEAEGAPAGWVAVVVSGDVASVRLVSPSGAVLDSMTPSSGVVVLATTGATALAGTSAVALDAGGATVATVATDQAASASGPGCMSTPPVSVPPTTVPGVDPTTSTTGPTTSTVVPPSVVPSVEPAAPPA